ncbi:MAG: HNH endonuclease [Candidatus Nitrohelix vancouverensis]|uniref:HNH endonuclease n=1 Tax=Candidatus Nitrohelix vancouverensis TaxID=2705534 RepID=A0A7T0C4W4_9BACT|nr:MAG: HNH endonuclease [Candidatus Nitrohelix vancouverensis]
MDAQDSAYRREREKAKKLKKTQWWQNLLARGECHFCGKIFDRTELTMDHLVPVSRGGSSSKGNVVPCCKPCNNEKKYLTPAEMILKNQLGKDVSF